MSAALKTGDTYDANSIQVLEYPESVRVRPGMYIGDTDDGTALHHSVYEIVDNSVDEHMGGHGKRIIISLLADGSCTVRDFGRGIPVDINEERGVSALELCLAQLHAGGKFEDNKVSGGLHGVGAAVVNALSEWMTARVWRNGKVHEVAFARGIRTKATQMVGKMTPEDQTGTEVQFRPDPQIFSGVVEFDFEKLERRFREIAFLNPGLEIILRDERHEPAREVTHLHEGGVASFVRFMDTGREGRLPEPILLSGSYTTTRRNSKGDDVEVTIRADIGLWWTDRTQEMTLGFTNNIPQNEGGTHIAGFRAGLTRTLLGYIASEELAKKLKADITGDDVRGGLTAIVSVKVPGPKFGSQTKNKLVSAEVQPIVQKIVNEQLGIWLDRNPKAARIVAQKVVETVEMREMLRKAQEMVQKSSKGGIASLPGKLADCQSRDPTETELFIVEGDSAGGSAKQGRQRRNQAILPLKGKILNVERAAMDKILSSAEVGTLIKAIGGGVGPTSEDGKDGFQVGKARYHKVIIMTDADHDGSHIRALLMTFFYRQMTALVEAGYLYIAEPPLYGVKRGQKGETLYLRDDAALQRYLTEHGLRDATVKLGSVDLDAEGARVAVLEARRFMPRFDDLAARMGDPRITAALLLHGIGSDPEWRSEPVSTVATRIGAALTSGAPNGTTWTVEDQTLVENTLGVVRRFVLADDLLSWPEVTAAAQNLTWLRQSFDANAMFIADGQEKPLKGPSELIGYVDTRGRKGLSIQRFKGLGEMNAEDLWKTTLDPAHRRLTRVTMDPTTEMDGITSTAMGDDVEKRRDWIVAKGPTLKDLDLH